VHVLLLVTLCYKLSINPLQGVLMRESVSRPRTPQIQLFDPPPQIPAWQRLPREIRQQTLELLAQLLRERSRRVLTGHFGKERWDE
jgi:hypothetical protein